MQKIIAAACLLGLGFAFPCHAGIIGTPISKEELVNLAGQPQFDAVGSIKQDGRIIASCVLIAPRWFITAAHVFDGGLRLGSIRIEINGHTCKPLRKITHRRYRRYNVDLALIEVDTVTGPVSPAVIYTGDQELHAVSTFVGYGAFGTALRPDMEVNNTQKIAGHNRIDQVGGAVPGFSAYASYFLLQDLDNPGDSVCCNPLGTAQPLDMEYIPTGGDSGGGLFIEENGKWYLAGIFSEFEFQLAALSKTGLYGTVAAFMRLSPYRSWISMLPPG